MKRICANCSHDGIEPGEAGAPSRCGKCGCTRFVESPVPKVESQPAPTPPPVVPVEVSAGRELFKQMHADVDNAKTP